MTDAQFGALITVLVGMGGAIAGVLRWAALRITGVIESNTKAMIENTGSNAVLSTKIDSVAHWVQNHTPTDLETIPSKRRVVTTKPHGIALAPTKKDDEE